MNVKFIADFKSTPRTDALLDNQEFDNVDYDTSCQQLTELCRELERDLNEAMLNVRECELEIKDLTIRAMEAEKSLAGKIILDRPFAPMPTESYPKTMQNAE
jgi:hypothetical protein